MHRAALVAIALALATPGAARAQDDDWGVTRDDGHVRDGAGRRARGRGRRPARDAGGRAASGASMDADGSAGGTGAGDAALRERYAGIVLSDPRDGFAMDRLLSLYRARDGSLAGLDEEMRARLVAAPEERGVRMVLGRILREAGRLEEARALYEEVLEANEGDALALRALATVALAVGSPERARAHLEAALVHADEADREETARALAEVLFTLEDWDAVTRLYGDLAAGSRATFLRTELARELQSRGEHERAIAALDVAAEEVAADRRALAPVLVLRATSLIALGRIDEAIATAERARAMTTASAGIRGEIAELLLDAYRRGDRLAELCAELAEHASGFAERMTLARALDELGRDDEAADAYARAAALAPRDPEPRTRAVRVLLRAGRLEDAVEVSEALVRHAPGDPRFVTALAELHASAGRRDEALRVLSAAVRRAPREVALHQAAAELYARWGEPARAEAELETLAELEPDDPAHLVALGDHRLSEGDRDGALEAFRGVLSAVPDAAAGHAQLGAIYADHDLLSEAIAELDQASVLAPGDVEHARELARVLERAGEDRRAEDAWQRVLELAAGDALVRREAREHVVALWTRGRGVASHATELRRRFEADAPDVEAGRFLAEVLRRRSELPQAIAVLRRVVALEPADLSSLSTLERLLVQADDRSGAIETLRALAEADRPNAAQYFVRMSEYASALYRDDDAIAYARRATELDPGGAAAFARLGALCRSRGDVAEARRALRRAHELDERADDTALALADLEIEAGEPARALEILRRVIEESPDDESMAQALRAAGALGLDAEPAIRDALLSAALDAPGRVAVRRLVVEAWSRATAPLRAAAATDRVTPSERSELRQLVTRALGPILGSLSEGSDPERRAALALVAPAEVAAAVPALLALAASDAPIDVRHEALVGAGRSASPAHLGTLRALAAPGNDLVLRVTAAWALGHLGDAAVPALREALAGAEPAVRAMAALGLGRSALSLSERSRAAVATDLEAALGRETQPGAAACIALGLSRLGPHSVAPYLAAPDRLAGTDGSSRGLLAAALAGVTDPVAHVALALHVARGTARESLLLALRRPASDPLAATPRRGEAPAAYALRSLALAEVEPVDFAPIAEALTSALSNMLEGSDAEARAALSALAPAPGGWTFPAGRLPGEAHGPQAPSTLVFALAPAVVRLARSGSSEARPLALALAAASGAPDAQALVVEMLDEGPASLSRVVLEALDASRSPAVVEAVTRALLHHDDWGVRALAARALAGIEGHGALEALRSALGSDSYAVVRDAAAEALGSLAPHSAVAASALCLAEASDEEPAVRARATLALGAVACPE